MAVSAVPGSGKTATIAALAARLLADRGAPGSPLTPDGQVLVVTYQNAAAQTLRARIRQELRRRDVAGSGFDVRTLHSLSFGIIRAHPGEAGAGVDFHVLDDRAGADLLERAVQTWNRDNQHIWESMCPPDHDAQRWVGEWTGIARSIGRGVISAAKNLRATPSRMLAAVDADLAAPEAPVNRLELDYLGIGARIYELYQQQVETVGGLDFNDMVRMAVDLLENHPDLAQRLAGRWSVILEDEAQDSVPLQEDLLGMLTSGGGNWVRVGDPNQSITSTFTDADPRYLLRFLDRRDVTAVEMAVSGRCSRPIMELANHLMERVCQCHPVSEVRATAFRRQHIQPTEPDDPQQNPPEEDSSAAFREYETREIELAQVAKRAAEFARRQPELTLSILVPTNRLGYEMAEVLRTLGVPFDERLQSSRSSRTVTAALGDILAFASAPLRRENLERVYRALRQHRTRPDPGNGEARLPADAENVSMLLRSCYLPERLLYPEAGGRALDALPPVGEIPPADLAEIEELPERLRRWLAAAYLPVDELVMAVAQELFDDADLARAQQVASFLRGRSERHPHWRLPELAEDLRQAAATGSLPLEEGGPFEPLAGRICLTTMHKAKGLEWDLVYLVGVDGNWFPGSLDDWFQGDYDFLGGDPAEIARSLANRLLGRAADDPISGDATRSGHVRVIAERLRLLYVAVTRARRYLAVSWSRETPAGMRTRRVPMAPAFEELRSHWEESRKHGS